jgi:hypothetical protein
VIDEYAIIDLIFVWFIPIIPPVIALIEAIRIIIMCVQFVFIRNDMAARGPNFCHVDRTRQFIHEIDDITDGNHI